MSQWLYNNDAVATVTFYRILLFSVHLKLAHQLDTLSKVCSDHDDIAALTLLFY